ncbi:MAG: AgmX/PglI C-terminal domain-containing protein [bacterium]|nr:AgmX/PglI C-terminal domain-containing protein [bacterium]
MARKSLVIRLLREGHPETIAPMTGRTVYMGHDWKCQIVDPGSEKNRSRLLVRSLFRTHIYLPPDAEGTFTYKGATLSISDMAIWGVLSRSKNGYRIRYRKGMTGRVFTRNATLVFDQAEISKPMPFTETVSTGHVPVKYRLQMPHTSDFTFLTLLTVILIAQVLAVRGLRDYPIPDVTTLREMPRRISRLILEPTVPQPSRITKAGDKSGPGAEEKTPEPERTEQAAAEETPAKTPPPGGTPAPATREAIRSQVTRMGVLGVLTGRGTAGRTTAGRGISVLQLDAELQQELDSVLGEISGITASAAIAGTGAGAGFGRAEPGSGLIGIDGQISDSGVSGPVQVSSIGRVPEGPPGIGDGSGDGTGTGAGEEYVPPELREERSNRAIARIVAAHTGAIRYAYNRELRKNPSLRGKVVLTFTISPEGQVTECRIEESAMDWPPLEESLVKMVKTWKFPEIPEGVVTVSYPLVFFPSM